MELRQRSRGEEGTSSSSVAGAAAAAGDSFAFSLPSLSGASDLPTVDELLTICPEAKHGFLQKRNTSLFHTLFPCCLRHWKPRYFVIVGGFCYRFSTHPNGKLKGVPIPLDACTIRQLKEGDVTLEPTDDVSACLELSMIRKSYILKASSTAECLQWVGALKARKAQHVRESLGHAPLSREIRALNTKAAAKFKRRIQKDTEEGEELRKQFAQNTSFNPMGMASMAGSKAGMY